MYSGNMGLGHDIETMLEAAKQLRDEPGIHFMFIGAGPKWGLVEETIQKEGLENVTLLPWQPEEVLPYSLATADVALVSLEPELWDLAIPSKAFYMMAAGSAILASTPTPSSLATIIATTSSGATLPVGNYSAICWQLNSLFTNNTLLSKLQSAARHGAVSYYARESNSKLFLSYVFRSREVNGITA